MTQKSDTKVLLLSLLITLGVIGGGVWWLTQNNQVNFNNFTNDSISNFEMSAGETILIPDIGTENKQAAIQDIKSKKYQDAITKLTQSLQKNRNDPEALIYLNNAKIGNKKTYTLAVVVPSKTNPNGALEILRGVAQAQEEINQKGGINGIPLKILITNDNNDPKTAQNLAEKLIDNPDVLGVIGHWASDVTLAAAEVYQANQLVAISPISTSVKLSSFGDYIFRTVQSDRFAGSALSGYMVNHLKKKKAAIFYNSQSNYSQSLKDEFTNALFGDGGEVIREFDVTEANFNAANDWQEAQKQGAEVLLLAVSLDTLDQALQIIQVNNQRLSLLAGDGAYGPKLLQIGGSDAIGMVLGIPWHILAHTQEPFAGASRQLWGAEVNWRTALAYDATQAFVAAIQQTPNPTRQTIQQALSNSGFSTPGASGKVRFLPSGDRNQAVQLVTIKAGNRSGFGYDFIPVP